MFYFTILMFLRRRKPSGGFPLADNARQKQSRLSGNTRQKQNRLFYSADNVSASLSAPFKRSLNRPKRFNRSNRTSSTLVLVV